MQYSLNHHQSATVAFTLSELLISLSVLGLIAALTLPAVFNSVNERKRVAVFKETFNAIEIAAVNESANEAKPMTGIDFLKKNMNVVSCSNTMVIINASPDVDEANGCILQNGADIHKLPNVLVTDTRMVVDWNGSQPPNVDGQDRINVWVNWKGTTITGPFWGGTFSGIITPTSLRPGELVPFTYQEALYQTLYK